MTKQECMDFIKAIKCPVNQTIIRLLLVQEEYVQKLAERMFLDKTTVTYHLNQLRKAKLVKYRYSHPRRYYTTNKDMIDTTFYYFGCSYWELFN